MTGTVLFLLNPMFRTRIVQLRKLQNLTQQALAEAVGIHVNQIRRWEAGETQPQLDALIGLARALHVSLDELVFDESERGPSDELALQFEAVSHMPDEERRIVKAVLDSMILQHQARRWSAPATLKPPSESAHQKRP